MANLPTIPYGWFDFAKMRRQGVLYVDKTRFLRVLEEERYAVLVRPWGFGKSSWVSVLEHYYDRSRTEQFDALFGRTNIGQQPTRHRNQYVILNFDFSALEDVSGTFRERFETYCRARLRIAFGRNSDVFPHDAQQRILAPAAVDGKLNELFAYAGLRDIPLYVIVDAYDSAANTALARCDAEASTQATEIYRSFFTTLKAGTAGGGIERLFLTGVLPITLGDATGGFNVGSNLTLDRRFSEVLGFAEADVRNILEAYRERGALDRDVDELIDVIREWCGGYRFAKGAEQELYNPHMVLHRVKHYVFNKYGPIKCIDPRVHIGHAKFRHLVAGQSMSSELRECLNGNLDVLRQVVADGWVDCNIESGFSPDRLDQRENFLSVLHYLGLLSIREVRDGVPRLAIPNQTVKELLDGCLLDAK